MNNLTGALSAAWTPGIRTNCIAVRAVSTEVSLATAARAGLDEAAFGGRDGLGRPGRPDEIGLAVLYLGGSPAFASLGRHWVPGAEVSTLN